LAPGPKCCGRVLLLPRPARPQHLSGAGAGPDNKKPTKADVHDRGRAHGRSDSADPDGVTVAG